MSAACFGPLKNNEDSEDFVMMGGEQKKLCLSMSGIEQCCGGSSSSISSSSMITPLSIYLPESSEDFTANMKILRESFPELQEGLICSMLESSNNDVFTAQNLLQQLRDTALIQKNHGFNHGLNNINLSSNQSSSSSSSLTSSKRPKIHPSPILSSSSSSSSISSSISNNNGSSDNIRFLRNINSNTPRALIINSNSSNRGNSMITTNSMMATSSSSMMGTMMSSSNNEMSFGENTAATSSLTSSLTLTRGTISMDMIKDIIQKIIQITRETGGSIDLAADYLAPNILAFLDKSFQTIKSDVRDDHNNFINKNPVEEHHQQLKRNIQSSMSMGSSIGSSSSSMGSSSSSIGSSSIGSSMGSSMGSSSIGSLNRGYMDGGGEMNNGSGSDLHISKYTINRILAKAVKSFHEKSQNLMIENDSLKKKIISLEGELLKSHSETQIALEGAHKLQEINNALNYYLTTKTIVQSSPHQNHHHDIYDHDIF